MGGQYIEAGEPTVKESVDRNTTSSTKCDISDLSLKPKKKTTSAMVRGQLQQSNSQKVCRGTFEMSGSSTTSVTVIVRA